jgi:hypothetical protein
MLRTVIGAAVVMVLCIGITMAEEIRAVITKVDGNNVTFHAMKGKEKGDAQTLPAAANVKVVKGKFNKDTKKFEVGDAVEGGLKSDVFGKIGEKGVGALIVTDDDNKKITEIRVTGGKKKAE